MPNPFYPHISESARPSAESHAEHTANHARQEIQKDSQLPNKVLQQELDRISHNVDLKALGLAGFKLTGLETSAAETRAMDQMTRAKKPTPTGNDYTDGAGNRTH